MSTYPARSLRVIAALVALTTIPNAYALSQRTFVSSYGVDTNPCSITQPCRTFGQAITQTAVSGEIIVLDSAGYGPMTILQPISIIAPPGIYAGVSVISGTGITVNVGAGNVTLRGLTIKGSGGAHGIFFQSGDALYLDSILVSGFPAGPNNGGLRVDLGASARVFVRDSTFRDNDIGASFGTTSGTLVVSMEGTTFEDISIGAEFRENTVGSVRDSSFVGSAYGIAVEPLVAGQPARVEVRNCTLSGSNGGGILVGTSATASVVVSLISSLVSGNTIGVHVQGTGNTAYISDTTITRNATGIYLVGLPTVVSGGDNRLVNNITDGAFTSTTSKL